MKAMDSVLSCLLLSAVIGLGEMYGKKVTVLLLEHLFTKYTYSNIVITIPLKINETYALIPSKYYTVLKKNPLPFPLPSHIFVKQGLVSTQITFFS